MKRMLLLGLFFAANCAENRNFLVTYSENENGHWAAVEAVGPEWEEENSQNSEDLNFVSAELIAATKVFNFGNRNVNARRKGFLIHVKAPKNHKSES